MGVRFIDSTGQPKVSNMGLELRVQQDVAGFYVAVNDGLVKAVEVGKPMGHATDDVDTCGPGKWGEGEREIGLVEPLVEVSLFDELVDEEAFRA